MATFYQHSSASDHQYLSEEPAFVWQSAAKHRSQSMLKRRWSNHRYKISISSVENSQLHHSHVPRRSDAWERANTYLTHTYCKCFPSSMLTVAFQPCATPRSRPFAQTLPRDFFAVFFFRERKGLGTRLSEIRIVYAETGYVVQRIINRISVPALLCGIHVLTRTYCYAWE